MSHIRETKELLTRLLKPSSHGTLAGRPGRAGAEGDLRSERRLLADYAACCGIGSGLPARRQLGSPGCRRISTIERINSTEPNVARA